MSEVATKIRPIRIRWMKPEGSAGYYQATCRACTYPFAYCVTWEDILESVASHIARHKYQAEQLDKTHETC